MQDLKARTRAFSLAIIQLTDNLPATRKAYRLGDQLFRSGTSVSAHYREAVRAKSDADFISKIEGSLQELEESTLWLELIIESGLKHADEIQSLLQEADELTAILVTVAKNVKARGRNNGPRSNR